MAWKAQAEHECRDDQSIPPAHSFPEKSHHPTLKLILRQLHHKASAETKEHCRCKTARSNMIARRLASRSIVCGVARLLARSRQQQIEQNIKRLVVQQLTFFYHMLEIHTISFIQTAGC
jgi:hypothetical protein